MTLPAAAPPASMGDLVKQLAYLDARGLDDDADEVRSAPIFTEAVRRHAAAAAAAKHGKPAFSQHGLLGGDVAKLGSVMHARSSAVPPDCDPRIYQNVAAPASVFVCGSQGSGKSHTLSCLLENCLIASEVSCLPRPLTAIAFHYDTFTSDAGGAPCEAAHLSSHPAVTVRVLCPPTNLLQMRRIYAGLSNVRVEELRFDETDLNTKRMLDLMAVSSVSGGGMPLYLHVVTRILRQLRLEQQHTNSGFNYAKFRALVEDADLTPGQRCPLEQRLDTLESFMVKEQVAAADAAAKKKGKGAHKPQRRGSSWAPKAGQLTIVDLSCPCVTAEAACALFNICLSLFLEQATSVGRVVALDEAHKYMTGTAECDTLTEALLTTIRLQRHQGARVFISTQEPTISPKLLDLCSATIVHRFTSPDWLRSIKGHLAGASSLNDGRDAADADADADADHLDPGTRLFSRIVSLRTGEALLFSPSAAVAVRRAACEAAAAAVARLEHGVIKIRIRARITHDGGRSIMAG